ncbi:MAG: LysR family transcriptional regulator, partial [Verrucomicrobiales bacterium]
MELHQLRYFLAVARTGNFSRAAEQCHVSQPSLSQQIAKLEDELGVRLFDRNKRHSSLTPHGEALLPRATRILDEVDTASREARDATELLRGKIRLGVLPTIAPYLLPDVIKNFARNYPGLEIVLDEDTTGQLLEKLLACDIDFALTSLPLGDPRFQTHHLFDEDLLLALPADHPLSRKKAIHTRDLRNERLIVMKDGHCLGDQVLGFC